MRPPRLVPGASTPVGALFGDGNRRRAGGEALRRPLRSPAPMPPSMPRRPRPRHGRPPRQLASPSPPRQPKRALGLARHLASSGSVMAQPALAPCPPPRHGGSPGVLSSARHSPPALTPQHPTKAPTKAPNKADAGSVRSSASRMRTERTPSSPSAAGVAGQRRGTRSASGATQPLPSSSPSAAGVAGRRRTTRRSIGVAATRMRTERAPSSPSAAGVAGCRSVRVQRRMGASGARGSARLHGKHGGASEVLTRRSVRDVRATRRAGRCAVRGVDGSCTWSC